MKKSHPFLCTVLVLLFLMLPVTLQALEIKVMTTTHDNGKLKERYSYFSDDWGLIWKHGLYTSWNYVGLTDEIIEYSYNSREGSYTRYIYAGDLSLSSIERGTYEGGRKVGTWNITPVQVNGLQGTYEYAAYGNVLVRQREQKKYLDGSPWFDEVCEDQNGNWLCVRTEYHSSSSGKVKDVSREEFSQGMIVRRWEGRHVNGAVSYTGVEFKYGGRQGRWNYWDDTGFLVRQTDFLDGQKHGLEIEYPAWEISRIKDKIIREFRYGVKQGDEKRYDEAGNLVYHHRYESGMQEGEQRDYWGALAPGKLEAKYFMKGGVKHGLYEQYYKTGGRRSAGQYADGLLEGLWEQFYEGGAADLRCNYRAGKLHGRWESFHENGQMSFQVDYEQGKASGTATNWRPDGTPEAQYTYLDDVKHGPAWYLWFDGFCHQGSCGSGLPSRREGAYGNGAICGTWIVSALDNSFYPPFYEANGPCEGLHVTNPEMPYAPSPPSNVREIRGRVTRAADGRAISGVQVYAGTGDPPAGCSAACAATDDNGFYSLLLEEAKSYPLQFTAGGYYSHKETADMTNRVYFTVNVQLRSMPPAQYGTPAVTKFSSKYGGVFLQGLPVSNTYAAAVNWSGGAPGLLRFTKNGTAADSAGAAEGGSLTYNMGSDFTAALSTNANTLTVEALGTDGKKSSAATLHPLVIPLPAWSVSLGGFTVKEENGAVSYGISKSWPEEPEKPFSAQINSETLGTALWTAWGFFPLVGGKEFGIPPTQFEIGVTATTTGVGSVTLGGKTGFAAAGGTIEGALKGTGSLRYESAKGLAFAGASVNAGITGSIKREVGPVTLIPALAGATEWSYVGKIFQWFNDTAKIDGTISVGTDLTLGIADLNGQIGFQPAEGALTTGIELGIGSEMEAFKTRLSGGGQGKVMWQVPANPSYYKGSEFTLNAKLDVNWKLFSFTLEGSHTFPEKTSEALSLPTGFRPVPRTFLNLGPYNQFVAATEARRTPLALRKPLEVTSNALVTNIYPYAGPAVAMHAGRLAMAYVYNDPSDLPLQATEIYTLGWENGAYTTPAPILNDTRAEFSPVLAFDGSGNLICVWERVNDENFTGTGNGAADMEAMAAKLEIVYAVRPPAGEWSVPVPLTNNAYLDHGPLLARSANGAVLLLWRSNAANALIGGAGTPTRLHYALWDAVNKVFLPSTDMGRDFINATQFSLAYRGDEATLAFVQDGDGNLATSTDQEIALARFNGTTWAGPANLTADAVADIAPQVLYDNNGLLQLAWRQADTVVRRTDAATGATENVRTGSGGLAFTNFRFFCAPDNRLVVVWQDISGGKVDLFYTARDAATGSWSGDVRLTNDPDKEQDMAGVFAADGALQLVYGREVPVTGRTDLYHLTYRLGGDLAITGADLRVDPAVPLPGQPATLHGVVRNVGDQAYQNVAVRFYLGDPAQEGVAIGSAVVAPAELKGGTTGEAVLAWTVPENQASYRIYAVVDPDNALTEATKVNNQAFFEALKPDLEMLSARVDNLGDGSVDVVALLRNSGALPSPPVDVLFSTGGKELGLASITRLEPGRTAEVSRRYWSGTDFRGTEIIFEVVADPDNKIAESSETNNRSGALFVAVPMASVVNDGLVFAPLAAGGDTTSLYVTIRNEGGADLLITEIQLSDTTNFRIDLNGGPAPLGSLTTPIPAGGARTIGVILAPAGGAVGEVQLSLVSNDPKTGSIILPAKMEPLVAAAPVIAAAPDNLFFGAVVSGTLSPVVMLSLTNRGTADLTISSLTLSDPANFSLDAATGEAPLGTLPAVLPPAARRTLAIRYSPQAVGSHGAQIAITSNDPALSSLILPLAGTCIAPVPLKPQALVINPLQYYFGTVAPGASSEPLTVFVANGGESPLRISGITLTETAHFHVDTAGGANPLGNLPVDIPPGESRTVTVTFSPTETRGYAAELLVSSDDPEHPIAALSLRGNDPFAGAADIAAAPLNLSFGEVGVGSASPPQMITITNNGGKDLEIKNLTSSEAAFAPHPGAGSAPLGALPALIPAGESRTLALTFTPAAAAGYTGTLVIFSNDPDTPELSLALTGTGQGGSGALPGDLNGSGGLDLADGLLALRLLAGLAPEGFVTGFATSGADVNGDGRVGLAEVLFILQSLAGTRAGSLPESEHPYANGMDQQWSYTLPGQPAALDVTFAESTAVEQGYDYLHVTDGAGTPVSGSPFTGTGLAGQTLRVPGDTVKIRLVSDASSSLWGFRVTNVVAAQP